MLITLIWVVWLVNQFINLIILLNFLIAVISQVYDNVVADQKLLMYKHRAELNREYFMIMRMFLMIKEFQIIVFSMDKELVEQEEEEWLGFVQSIKQFV